MSTQIVFSGNLNPSAANLSNRFTEASVFFIEAPLLNVELEIDVFLQVYLPGVLGETTRNIPLGKIESQAILLNVTDTETASLIPLEYQNTDLEMALLFLASDTTYLYAVIVKPDCNLCLLKNQLNQLNTKVDLILAYLNLGVPVFPASVSGSDFTQLNILGII
jgi:hypothetical protein